MRSLDAHPRHFRLLSRQRRGAGRRRRDRRRRAGRALHAQEARCGFPANALRYCLAQGGIGWKDVDHVVFYDKPFLKFERLVETYLAFAPRGFTVVSHGDSVVAAGKALPEGSAEQGDPQARRRESRLERRAAVQRAPSEPRGQRVLPVAVRGSGGADDGRRGRMGHDLGRDRPRQHARGAQGDPLSAFAGPAVFGLHLLHRLQGQFGRIQGHGPGALRRAEVRGQDPRAPDRRQGRRLVPARPAVLQLLHRPDHDERQVRRAVRRAACAPTETGSNRPHGPGGLDSGGDGRGGAAAHALAAPGNRHRRPVPGRRRGAELRRQRQGPARRAVRRIYIQPAAGDAGGALGAALVGYHMHGKQPRKSGRDAMRGSYLGPVVRPGRHRGALDRGAARSSR